MPTLDVFFFSPPGLELLKREAGSKLTQPGVSAAPTRHSLTVGAVKGYTDSPGLLSFYGVMGHACCLSSPRKMKDTGRVSPGS